MFVPNILANSTGHYTIILERFNRVQFVVPTCSFNQDHAKWKDHVTWRNTSWQSWKQFFPWNFYSEEKTDSDEMLRVI